MLDHAREAARLADQAAHSAASQAQTAQQALTHRQEQLDELREAVEHVINELNKRKLRLDTRESDGKLPENQMIKKAVRLWYRLNDHV
ncbi:hypothetical protein AB4142_32035, partial [Variovorax sp. 2RAF20]